MVDSEKTSSPYVGPIHAPREGCDFVVKPCKLCVRGFNSRTPGGVRPGSVMGTPTEEGEFQFTHPGRGATNLTAEINDEATFQFTHPGRGATNLTAEINDEATFQFTHPGRGATASARP